MTIPILNAPPGHCQAVGEKRALRLVKRGRAMWNAERTAILIEAHALIDAAAIEHALAIRRENERTGRGYDREQRLMRPEEAQRTPFVGDAYKLYHGKRLAFA